MTISSRRGSTPGTNTEDITMSANTSSVDANGSSSTDNNSKQNNISNDASINTSSSESSSSSDTGIIGNLRSMLGCSKKVNILITYLLWLPFGFFGLHHIYLGRYEQAIAYGQTFSLFGLGYILDLFYIPSYVADINARGNTTGRRTNDTKATSSCSGFLFFSFMYVCRFLVTLLIAFIYATMMESTWKYTETDSRFIEDSGNKLVAYIMLSIAAAYGARLIGNIGHSTSSFRNAFFGAIAGLIYEQVAGGPDSEGIPAAVAAAFGAALLTTITRITLSKPLPYVSKKRRNVPICCCCFYKKGDNGCFSTIGSILLFWLSLPLLLILHADIPVNKDGLVDRRGLTTMKLGNYIYNHPEQSWKQISDFIDEFNR